MTATTTATHARRIPRPTIREIVRTTCQVFAWLAIGGIGVLGYWGTLWLIYLVCTPLR